MKTNNSTPIIIEQKLTHEQNAPVKNPQLETIVNDKSISSIKLFGINIIGVDPRLVAQANLSMDISLNNGNNTIMGLDKDAKIKTHDNSHAKINLKLTRNADGLLSLKDFSLNFNPSIVIKNPSASLEPRQDKSRIATAIKDKIVNVKLSSIAIDDRGHVAVNGKIKALHLFKASLPKKPTTISLPVLDEATLVSLGILEGAHSDGISTLGHLSQRFDVKKIFKTLGIISKEASYSLNISGDHSHLRFAKDNNFFQGPASPLKIFLEGSIDLEQQGDLVVLIDGKRSSFSGSLGTYAPHLQAKVSHLLDERPVSLRLQGEISGVGRDLKVDTFSKQEVKTVMPRRRHTDKNPLSPQHDDDFNTSFGVKNVEVRASVDLNAEFAHHSVNVKKGSVHARLIAHEPYAKTHERGITMEGELSTHLSMPQFSYNSNDGLQTDKATIKFGLHPNEKTRQQFSEIKPVEFGYQVRIDNKERAEITPPEYGITRFLRPIKNLEAHDERVDTKLTKTNIAAIGSNEYFGQIEKISGIRPKRADEVELLIDGVRSMPKRLELIDSAKDFICFQTLAFKSDTSGWKYAQALVKAAKRGVKVRGVIDSLGNIESLKDVLSVNPVYKFLENNGVELFLYNGSLEQGLRSIFSIAQTNPGLLPDHNSQSLMGVAELIRFFEVVANAAEGTHGALSLKERTKLRNAINIMMGGKEGSSPHNAISELKQAISGNMTTLDEFLLAIKRVGDASYRWHEKYLIVDGHRAILGGMNIADEYLRGGSDDKVVIKNKSQPAWRDSDVYISGDVVQDIARNFKNNWLHVAKREIDLRPRPKMFSSEKPKGAYKVGIIHHRPLEDGDHNVTNFLLYNLRTLGPKEKAWFETPYFLPRGALRSLQKEMVLAAKRGVDLRILTNSEKTSDFGPLVEAATFDTRELLRAGARVFERNNDRMVHAKVYVLGDMLTIVGSWNMDNRSAAHDSEDVCAIYDEGITKQMSDQLEIDMFKQSDEVTLKSLENRSLGQEIRSATMLLMGELI